MKFLTVLTLLVLSTSAYSADNTSAIHVDSGSWSLSTSRFDMVVGSARSAFSVSPTVEYFVTQGVGVGGTVGLSSGTEMNAMLSVGPSATYHFWQQDQVSAYTSSSLILGNVARSNNMDRTLTFNIGLGANYNFTPWFGIGPRINMSISQVTNVELGLINLFVYL